MIVPALKSLKKITNIEEWRNIERELKRDFEQTRRLQLKTSWLHDTNVVLLQGDHALSENESSKAVNVDWKLL